jgi:putative glutathione S-transferase
MLNSEFNKFARHADLDLYPESLRARIDELNEQVYPKLNNGVYRAGFAKSQEAYDAAFEDVFSMLDTLEDILSKQRYLIDNEHLTEADVRAWTTLLRFDPVYFTLFKCNKKMVSKDYPNLYGFVREIYQIDGIKDIVNIDEIRKGYFAALLMVNPTGIIARGPEINYDLPHGRDHFKQKQ